MTLPCPEAVVIRFVRMRVGVEKEPIWRPPSDSSVYENYWFASVNMTLFLKLGEYLHVFAVSSGSGVTLFAVQQLSYTSYVFISRLVDLVRLWVVRLRLPPKGGACPHRGFRFPGRCLSLV